MRRILLTAALLMAAGSAAGLDLQGHRGARGLLPENTLPAFARALSIGISTSNWTPPSPAMAWSLSATMSP